MIILRFDVDYPYPSRLRSIFYVLRKGKKEGNDYLKNAKIIARMINNSALEVKAYWFFTPYTTPDQELLELLDPQKHEIGVHVAVDANAELNVLQKVTKRQIEYYTIHGTERLLGRLLWRRKRSQAKVEVSKEVPLKSFHEFAPVTVGLDRLAYDRPLEKVLTEAHNTIERRNILHAHPEWLFQKGKFNHRGPYYEELRRILEVDKEFDILEIRKKGFIRIGKYSEQNEYMHDIYPDKDFTEKLAKNKTDVFTFIERRWSKPIANPSKQWRKAQDNIALLQVSTYEAWWQGIDKKTRNMVRKAEKSEIKVEVAEPSDKLAEGIYKIYNETPFRQGRAFSHYGQSLERVKNAVYASKNDTFISATLNGEVVGFIQLVFGDNIAIISQILSLQQHWDKAVNNLLVAKAVEVCASKNIHWVMYGRIGNHPSLDKFKESNNFTKYPLTRYYIPLSRKGKIAVALGLHRNLKDVMPEPLKKRLFGFYNWVSRTKTKLRIKNKN